MKAAYNRLKARINTLQSGIDKLFNSDQLEALQRFVSTHMSLKTKLCALSIRIVLMLQVFVGKERKA
jgi:hypothetical protein